MVATIFVLRSMGMNLAAWQGASPELVEHLLSGAQRSPKSGANAGRIALQERWRDQVKTPSCAMVSPSADSRPPKRRSVIRSQWTAEVFVPPVSG